MENKHEKTLEFCRGRKCCPTLTVKEDGSILIGGSEEGYTKFSKQNLEDFVHAAKSGAFDGIV